MDAEKTITNKTVPTPPPPTSLVKTVKSAFNARLLTLEYNNSKTECLVPETFLKEAFEQLQHKVKKFLKVNIAFKFNIVLSAVYAKQNPKDLENTAVELKYFPTDTKEVFDIKCYEELFKENINSIVRQTEEFHGKCGSWSIVQLIKLELNLYRYQPLKGSSYIPLPSNIVKRHAIINVKNKDIYCFKWALMAAIADLGQRPNKYNVGNNISCEIIKFKGYNLNFKGLSFPLKLNDISIFEDNNPNISINVFGYDKETNKIVGPYYRRKAKRSKHINLLFLQDKSNSHYVWIKNMSRLLKSQLTQNPRKLYICDDCLQHYNEKNRLEEHFQNDCQKIVNIPKKDNTILEFKNCDKTIDVPFVIYANSTYIYENLETRSNPKPYAFCYFIKCNFNETLDKLRCFKGHNAAGEFVKSLIKDVNYFYSNYLTKLKPIKQNLNETENLEFLKNDKCHICLDKINNCEIFVKEFYSFDNEPINFISQNKNDYISLTKIINTDIGAKIEIRFLDSFRFLPKKLADLVKDLKIQDFKIIKSMFPNDDLKFNLLIRKGVFPFDYLNSWEKLNDTCLPSREQFYNQLNELECSLEDYKHAQDIWTTFKCKILQDYLIMHLKTNVMLQTDVFEYFRRICKCSYSLDPCHYYTAEELSWDAMLKITKFRFASLTDKTMISFLQKGLRGDVAVCSQRYAKANNKYLEDYNDQLPAKYLIQFENENLYDWAMSQVLPERDFKWLTDVEKFSLDSLTNDNNYGYILEVDLKYPQEVHDLHNSLPFCCEKKTFLDFKEEKLLVDLNDKHNYIIYHKNLQQCLKHGLKLQKIHRILKFKQSNWLEKYIIINGKGKTNFEKYVFRLLNKALYNKIMEKRYKDTTIKVFNKWENEARKAGVRAYVAKAEFRNAHIFEENLVAIELDNTYSYYKPIYLEFIILELIKWKMYNFHYDCMMPKFNDNIQLNYMDANVLIYTITMNDIKIYKDLKFLQNLDFKVNEKIFLKCYIGLRSKMYSLKIVQSGENVCKNGIISLTNLKFCFSNKTLNCLPFSEFNSKLHNLYSELIRDESSKYLDNKRIIYYDNINTLSRGHYKNDDCVMSE
ncbi:uncharacterized protein LOC124419769 [Lucilia cuprina]|uniref:uncharacterized protein LOC124419769 n=1 Tax=Lucilia cuprina TaxID=7375 RepID=UPI001F0668E8|nr:uncharacterized protein LOC124419769 [Lucilia cuprina]